MPQTAAIYARISEDRTGAGLGVARQEQDCRQLAERLSWTVAEVYDDDDISAYSGKRRPSYERMLDDLSVGRRDGVLIWHPDRLHRSTSELDDFIKIVERTGIPVATVTAGDIDLTTPAGRMTARIIGAVSRHESEHKAERIVRKHLELAQAGKLSGGGHRPFGYEADRVTVREDEAALIRQAALDVLAGAGVRTIATAWAAAGVPSVTGAQWSATTVRRLLHSGRIAGWREHHGVLVAEAAWPAIVDMATHRALRAILDDPARANGIPTNARSYLLSGFLVCGACGARLVARPVVRRGRRYRRYGCVADRGGCNQVGIGAEPVEALIERAVLARLDSPAMTDAIAATREVPSDGDDRVAEIEGRAAELAEMFAGGEITRAEWLAAKIPLDSALADARRQAGRQARRSGVTATLAEPAKVVDQWPTLPLERKRAVLAEVLASVTVEPTERRNNRFDPRRIDPTKIKWRQ